MGEVFLKYCQFGCSRYTRGYRRTKQSCNIIISCVNVLLRLHFGCVNKDSEGTFVLCVPTFHFTFYFIDPIPMSMNNVLFTIYSQLMFNK